MKVLFINNEGSGYASHVDVEPGTTVARLFEQRLGPASVRLTQCRSTASTRTLPARTAGAAPARRDVLQGPEVVEVEQLPAAFLPEPPVEVDAQRLARLRLP